MRYLRRTQPLPTTADQPAETDVATLFSGVLWQVRWVVLAGLLLLSFAQPLVGRAGLPTWARILRRRTALLKSPAISAPKTRPEARVRPVPKATITPLRELAVSVPAAASGAALCRLVTLAARPCPRTACGGPRP